MSTLALLGGKPVGGIVAPQFPSFDRKTISKVTDMLERGDTVALGRYQPALAEAEDAIAKYHGGRFTLLLNSGHAALMGALMGLEIGQGDEVITTPYTWGASISCILCTGAVPVFVDIDRVTGLIDPARIEAAITPRTRAILAVHLYGQPADMPAINRIARRHGLFTIEDGSQAHGARINGRLVGNHSDAAGFSCMGGKLLATTEAGYMLAKKQETLWKAAMMSQHYGRCGEAGFPEAYKPYADSLALTFRVSSLTAALFPGQIARLDKQNRVRGENVHAFRDAMKDCDVVELPRYPARFTPSFHMTTMLFRPDVAGVTRGSFLRAVQAEGAAAHPYVPEPLYRSHRLHWKGYKGPEPYWMPNLRRAKTNYARLHLPNCEHKVANSIELSTNSLVKPMRAGMKRLARCFLKVQDNLDALRKWEQEQATGD